MNILLTGEIGIGKSRLLDMFLREYKGSIGGYKTIRAKTNIDDFFGVYMRDINDQAAPLTINNRVGACSSDKSLICHNAVLEKAGEALLNFETMPSFIVMDEIGVLESSCILFTDTVLRCLGAKTDVVGIIKKKPNSFLDSIIKRSDVIVPEVTGSNDEYILRILKKRHFIV